MNLSNPPERAITSCCAASLKVTAIAWAIALSCAANRLALAEEPLEFVHRWQLEPDLGVSWVKDPDKRPKPVDLTALSSDSLKRCIEQARYITRFAANIRFAREQDQVLDALIDRLRSNEQNRQVRLALFSAAVAMSDGKKADELWKLAENDVAARPVIEEALIRWQSPVAREYWRGQLASSSTNVAAILRSLNGMRVTGETSDLDALEVLITQASQPLPVRIAACEAYGAITSKGAESLALQVLDSNETLRHLMAAKILAGHKSQQCLPILNRILNEGSLPAVSSAILTVAKVAPEKVDDSAESWLAHLDSAVRTSTIQALGEMESERSLNSLAIGLEDKILEVRAAALGALIQRSRNPKARADIDQIVDHYLATGTYRSLEQVIQLVVHLQDHDRCPRFIELLEHPRAEVSNTAAWALDRLVEQGDTQFLNEIHSRAKMLTKQHFGDSPMTVADSVQVAFLFEILGKYGVSEADEMLQRYIPKYIAPTVARAAAIWALGKIWENQGHSAVTKKLSGRLHDYSPSDPEDQEVKYVCTIAMAMIAHPDTYADIERFHGRPPNQVGIARGWALEYLQAKAKN